MKKSTRFLTHAAIIAALYVGLTYLQNLLVPESATWAIQFRVAEALCVLAFFTPAAIPGLGIGCLLFNISYAGALPLDFVVGTLASLLAAGSMYLLRNVRIRNYPLAGMLMPAIWNALFVGWELTVYIGNTFAVNALCVALGEVAVMLTVGSLLWEVILRRKLDRKLFG